MIYLVQQLYPYYGFDDWLIDMFKFSYLGIINVADLVHEELNLSPIF